MASVKTRERQIANLEGFDVNFLNDDGRNTRSDLAGILKYDYDNAAMNSMTVSEWMRIRFSRFYRVFRCEVLDGEGKPVHGATLLSTVRETYQGE